MPNDGETYTKTGTAGAEGVDFQLNLTLHVLLQVKKLELVSFKLYSELEIAGKFDDIVLIYEDKNKKERCCLLQSKHVIAESKTVSFNDLVSSDKYGLTKYFDSFKEIIKEEQFKDSLEHLILFTNLNLSESLLPYVEEVQPQLPIWNCQTLEGNEKKPVLYKLKSEFVDDFIDQYSQKVPHKKLKCSSKSKGSISLPIPFNHDDTKLFRIFCSYLILALNQPNDGELEEMLTSECAEYFSPSMAKMAKSELKFKIRQWFKANKSSHLTSQFLDEEIKFIKNNELEVAASYVSRCEVAELFKQKIRFKTLSLMSDIEKFMKAIEKKIFLITTRNLELSSIKTISSLRELNHEYLFTSQSNIREGKEAFNQSKFFNLLVWHHLANATTNLEIFFYQLSELLNDIKNTGKKVIVIISESISAKQLEVAEDLIQQINDETQFGHLTEDTRQELLKRIISLQGYDMETRKIVEDGFRLDKLAHNSWGNFLSRSSILIGQEVNLSQEYNSDYYIPRTIVVTDLNSETKQSLSESEFIQHALLEDQGLSLDAKTATTSNKINRKVFILSDPAGMGKTTVSSSLAYEIKRSYPHYWVTRLVAMECASDLNNFDESTTLEETYDSFLMSKLLKLSSPLERFVFRQYLKNENLVNKFIIIFDGYDEIDEKCQRVIIEILQYLSRRPNVGFIIITTRPQFEQSFYNHFKQNACILKPFDEKNKIEFLRLYWTPRDTIENPRLTDYANKLIKFFSSSITETESQLTGIPLQMRMIAEIFAKEASLYVMTEENDIDFSSMPIGLFDLYEKFMKMKKDCLEEKSKDGGSALNTEMIKCIQQHQSRLACDLIIRQSDTSKTQDPGSELTTHLGIIQKSQEGKFYFIHRTFAEFLTAKYLLEEFIQKDDVSVADKLRKGLLIEQMKNSSLHVVRKFINSKLDGAKLAEECKMSGNEKEIRKLLGDKLIVFISAMEEIDEFLKLKIEVDCWLEPEPIFSDLEYTLEGVGYYSKYLTPILDCMIDKWLEIKDDMLMKIINFLIRKILVNDTDHKYIKSELITSTINFQNEMEKGKMLNDERLIEILNDAVDDVVNRGMYWNWYEIKYLEHLHSKYPELLFKFLNNNRPLLHGILQTGGNDDSKKFLALLKRDKEINVNWVFDNFIEVKFNKFGFWEDEHFKLYLTILHFTVEQLESIRKEKFWNYLENVIQFLYQQTDLSWEGLYSEYLEDYKPNTSLDEIRLRNDITKTAEDLEYCALWGQTDKLREILKKGDIEVAAVKRFRLNVRTDDLAATRRTILSTSRERQGDEDFLKWIGQKNWRNRTILQHALSGNDDLIIELISEWITTEEIFEQIMKIASYHESKFKLFLNFVNKSFPQYRMRFLEMNKNVFISDIFGRQEILRIIENDELSKIDLVQILNLKTEHSGYDGSIILHHILHYDDVRTIKKWLNLVRELDPGTITQLFSIRNKSNMTPLDYITFNTDHILRQRKKEICNDFFVELNLLELNNQIKNLVYQSDSRMSTVPGH